MSWVDLIGQNREKILNMMQIADADAFRNGSCEYRVYIDTDGEVGSEEWPANDSGWYEFHGDYDRCYIHTFCHQYYNALWDYWFADLDAAEFAFMKRFGYPVVDATGYLSADMWNTVLLHGGSIDELVAWENEMTGEAIKDLTDGADYDVLLDERIGEMEDDK